MFRTLTGRTQRQRVRTLRYRRSAVRRSQSMAQVGHYWKDSDWDKCLRAHEDTALISIFHNGGRPISKRRYTPYE